MKIRDSGMSEDQVLSNLFDTELILTEMQINSQIHHLVQYFTP